MNKRYETSGTTMLKSYQVFLLQVFNTSEYKALNTHSKLKLLWSTYHICSLIFFPSNSIVLILKSIPAREKKHSEFCNKWKGSIQFSLGNLVSANVGKKIFLKWSFLAHTRKWEIHVLGFIQSIKIILLNENAASSESLIKSVRIMGRFNFKTRLFSSNKVISLNVYFSQLLTSPYN